LKQYISEQGGGVSKKKELLDLPSLAEERIFLALRTVAGLNTETLREVYSYSLNDRQKQWLRTQIEHETLTWKNANIRFTNKGLKISDLLIVDFLSKQ